jgi:small subunit ribosomal protein S17
MENKPKAHKELTGVVVKLSGANTLKVRVERKYPHKKYGKIIKEHRHYLVDYKSENSDIKVGALVTIRECKPLSKMKAWELITK